MNRSGKVHAFLGNYVIFIYIRSLNHSYFSRNILSCEYLVILQYKAYCVQSSYSKHDQQSTSLFLLFHSNPRDIVSRCQFSVFCGGQAVFNLLQWYYGSFTLQSFSVGQKPGQKQPRENLLANTLAKSLRRQGKGCT